MVTCSHWRLFSCGDLHNAEVHCSQAAHQSCHMISCRPSVIVRASFFVSFSPSWIDTSAVPSHAERPGLLSRRRFT